MLNEEIKKYLLRDNEIKKDKLFKKIYNYIDNIDNNEKLNFGKYKNKTYGDIIKNKEYIKWLLNESINHNEYGVKFINYIKNDEIIMFYLEIIESNNVSKIAEELKYNKKILDILEKKKIQEKIEKNSVLKFSEKLNDEKNINLGTYMDYMIRYELSNLLNINFKDNRCELITNEIKYIENIHNLLKDNKKDIEQIEKEYRETNNINYITYICNICFKDENIYENSSLIDKLIVIKNSYEKIKNNCEIIKDNDIINISQCHKIFFGNKNINVYDENIEFVKEQEKEKIKNYLKEKIKKRKKILINPPLSSEKISFNGDADIIIDKELIDIKSSIKEKGLTKEIYIQLYLYSYIYYLKNGIIIKKITIYNPLLSKENYMNIEIEEILKIQEILEIYKK
jgi:hypothetical protein